MFNLIQVEHGQEVAVDESRTDLLTQFGIATLEDRYLLPGETPHGHVRARSFDLCRRHGMRNGCMTISAICGSCPQRPC